jgi:hypothetical protein
MKSMKDLGGSDMLAVNIIVGVMIWWMLGCLLVAALTVLGLSKDLGIQDTTNVACAIILWPIILIFAILLLFAKLAQHLGRHPKWLLTVFLFMVLITAYYIFRAFE